MQCQMEITKKEGQYEVKPSYSFPVATGKLCQKGLQAVEHTISEQRIRTPFMRSDRKDAWSESTWDDALSYVADNILSLQQAHGKDAVAVYGGGSLTNEMSYLLGKFTRVALQSKYIDYNGRYCMSSAATAATKAFGIDRGMTFPLQDIAKSKYIILAGTNIAECQPTMMPYLLQAKKAGATIVTIDPRNTLTSKIGDIHVRLEPGHDSIFVNGLLHVIISEQWWDHTFIEERTSGIASLMETVASYTPERVEEMTGILAAKTRTIARQFAQADSGIVMTARGVEQQADGVDNTLNYINLCLVTGKIGREGCGFGAVTGQANGQGGREHGQKADQLPGYRSIENEKDRNEIAKVWGIEAKDLPRKGVSAYELFDKIHQGEIKAMMVLGSNPVVSSPNSSYVEAALQKLDLLIVIDLFETETAQYADVFLPGSSFLEAAGTLTNLEGRVFYRPQASVLPKDAKLDSEIIVELATRLGKGAFFPYETAEDIFDELCVASKGGKADYSGLTIRKLVEHDGVFWPCPTTDHAGTPTMFEHTFAHHDGRAYFHAIVPKWSGEAVDEHYPHILTTGRLGIHYLSGSQTRRTPKLQQKAPVPVAEIHPWLAKKIKLAGKRMIKITSRRGSITLQAKITDKIQPNTIFVPFHWGKQLSINTLTSDQLEATCRMPEFKRCAVKVEAM